MTTESARLELAKQIAEQWNTKGIKYAVVHGLKDYPDSIGRDLDLVMHKKDVCNAMGIAIEVGRQAGFDSHLARWSAWGLYQLALIDSKNGNSLPLDFMCTALLWQAKFINFVSKSKFNEICHGDGNVGPFCVSGEGVFIKACLRPLVCGDLRRFGDLNRLTGKEEFSMPVELPEMVDRKDILAMVGGYGMKLLELPSRNNLESAFPAAMSRLQALWVINNPISTIMNIVNGFKRHISLWVMNTSQVLLIKTNQPKMIFKLIDQSIEAYKREFIEIRVFQYQQGAIKKPFGFFNGWRYKPVSEFNLSIVIQYSECHGDRNIARKRAGRWFFGPEYEISLCDSMSNSKREEFINKAIIDFLKEQYSYSNCFNL